MLELGLVGKPNTGKTTFFNAATLAEAPVANYPFTTIDANVGVTSVRSRCPCDDFELKCNPQNSLCIDGIRYVPVRIIDVAGLVEGAHEGRGLGNKFLDNLRMAAALIHVIDAAGATDAEGKPCPPGSHDPMEDIGFLEVEIALWLRSLLAKDWPKFARRAKYEELDLVKVIAERLSGLGIKEKDAAIAALIHDSQGKFTKEYLEPKSLDDLYLMQDTIKVAKPETFVSIIRQREAEAQKPRVLGTVGGYNQETGKYEGGVQA